MTLTRRNFALSTRLLLCLLCLAAFSPAPARADLAGNAGYFYENQVHFENLDVYRKVYRFYVTGQTGRFFRPVGKDGLYDARDLPDQVKDLRLCAVPQSLPLKRDGQPFDTYFTRPAAGVLFSEPFEVDRERHHGRPMTIQYRYKVRIAPLAAEQGKPAGKKLTISLVSRTMSSAEGYLFGVPVLACLGLVLRTRRGR